jgi:hypothetical protein
MGLASGGSSFVDSFTSGEGLMCFFQGPGTVYVQSHKLKQAITHKPVRQRQNMGPLQNIIAMLVAFGIVAVMAVLVLFWWRLDQFSRISPEQWDRARHGYYDNIQYEL